MTTVAPPPPPPPPIPAAATPAPQPVLVVADPPAAAARLLVGAILDGTVTAAPDKGTLQLKTPLGALSAQPLTTLTAATLPRGSALVLQVLSASPRFQLQINSIDAKPPFRAFAGGAVWTAGKGGVAAATMGKTATMDKAATGIRGGLPPLAAGTRFTATLTTPARTTDTTQTAQTAQTAKSTGGPIGKTAGVFKSRLWALTGIRKGAKSTAGQAAKTHSTIRSTALSTSRATVKGGAPGGGGARNASVLPTGTQVPMRVAAVAAATAAARRPAAAGGPLIINQGGRITGTVAGVTTSGNPVFRTPGGSMVLGVRAETEEGSSVTLEVIGRPKIPSRNVPGQSPAEGNEIIDTGRWPALGETLTLLAAANPAAARHLAARVIPRLDSSLSAGTLFFISALRGGDLRGWLGEGLERTLQRLRPGLLGRLGDDFKTIRRTTNDPKGGEWRSMLIPLLSGEGIEHIRLHMRRHDDGDGEGAGDDKAEARFIIDLSLSRMGRMQLDGLVRGGESKRLDLIVRSPSPLSPAMREDIRRIFRDAGEATGIKGGVTFQAAANFIDIGRTNDVTGNEGLTV